MKARNEGVTEIESPSGLDLNPPPPSSVRLSKRAGFLVLAVVFAVAALLGYGIISRSNRQLQAGFHPGESKSLTAATDAGRAIAAQIPGRALTAEVEPEEPRPPQQELRPPLQSFERRSVPTVRQQPHVPATHPQPADAQQLREPTAEEKRLILAYKRELQALDAPTIAHSSGGGWTAAASQLPAASSGASQLASLVRSLGGPSTAVGAGSDSSGIGLANASEGAEAQKTLDGREAFLSRARAASSGGYLASSRTKPAGRYEIKAGWEIPAVLEQGLNSDLPGEIKALVRENVYDTATGKYLLIPQGARLIGVYDSRVAYGQNGIQVVWNRLIFPDGSSIELAGMIGQDAGGHAGLRHDVDNHYKRLIGFGLLTSVFSAAFQLSQSRRGTVFGYPSAVEIAGSAVGAQVSQLGADVTRRNLDIQPTIKVPIGYRFNVRVNRDLLFDSPYSPAG
jgi:type IV secretory pathway VirB10-like protein